MRALQEVESESESRGGSGERPVSGSAQLYRLADPGMCVRGIRRSPIPVVTAARPGGGGANHTRGEVRPSERPTGPRPASQREQSLPTAALACLTFKARGWLF